MPVLYGDSLYGTDTYGAGGGGGVVSPGLSGLLETGALWSLVGPDGTTIQFNAGGSLYLEEVTGFDSPTVREDVEDVPEQDGAIAGGFFFGSRQVVLTGRIVEPTVAQRNATVSSMQRALRAIHSDLVISSQSQGMPNMQAKARLQNFRLSGGFVKQFQIGLVCADPRIYSVAVNTQTRSGTGTVTCTNAGNAIAYPTIRITAMNTPSIVNLTNGGAMTLAVNQASPAWVEVDMLNRTVLTNLGISAYGSSSGDWWGLEPGPNTVSLGGTANTGAALSVTWRDTAI